MLKILVIFLFDNFIRTHLNFIAGLLLFFNFHSLSIGQSQFFGLSSVYDDVATEWIVLSADSLEEYESNLTLKWFYKNKPADWQIDHLGNYWDIELRKNAVPQTWTLQSNNFSVTVRQRWRNDITEWRISTGSENYIWKTEYGNDLSWWYFEDDKAGFMQMWTTWDGDPRDWEIEDNAPLVADEIKLCMIFITMYFTNALR